MQKSPYSKSPSIKLTKNNIIHFPIYFFLSIFSSIIQLICQLIILIVSPFTQPCSQTLKHTYGPIRLLNGKIDHKHLQHINNQVNHKEDNGKDEDIGLVLLGKKPWHQGNPQNPVPQDYYVDRIFEPARYTEGQTAANVPHNHCTEVSRNTQDYSHDGMVRVEVVVD